MSPGSFSTAALSSIHLSLDILANGGVDLELLIVASIVIERPKKASRQSYCGEVE